MEGLSEEMTRRILDDLIGDLPQFQNTVQRMQHTNGGKITYQDVEFLRYVIKQMEVKVKILGGSWYA